ncbi:MAG: DegV family protein [Christensenellales bacterium]|jgi:DegV family protein with EDD domain
MSYQLFTDATADLTPGMMRGLPAVEIIPMEIELDGEIRRYGPGGDLEARDFYAALRGGKYASTSQINPAVYRAAFEPHLRAGRDVLYLCFSSALSSTIETASVCMGELRQEYPDRKIMLVDTRAASAGEGFLVCEAARRMAQGETIDALAQWVIANRFSVCHWFTVDTFEHLRRGGRVSAAVAAMGTLLQIKPLLHVDETGALKAAEKPRGKKQAVEAQLARMKKGWDRSISPMVAVGHGDAPAEAEKLRGLVAERFPDADIHVYEINPVIGAHTGPGILALVFWGNER